MTKSKEDVAVNVEANQVKGGYTMSGRTDGESGAAGLFLILILLVIMTMGNGWF